MQSELKPCPFCAGAPHLLHCGAGTYMIQCLQCKATTDDGSEERISGNWNRRAALSDQERAVEVKASPSDVFQVLAEFYRNGQFDFGHAPEMSRRLAALVDVQGEPVAWQRRTDSFGWQIVNAEDLGHYRAKGAELRPVYTRPPHREGEDRAEVIGKARALATAILRNFSAMEDGNGEEAPELAMARELLAAMGSGSPTTAKGPAE